MEHYRYGRKKEFQVGEFLERRGFKWHYSLGSRGPVDIFAWKSSNGFGIQVKSTRSFDISYFKSITVKAEKRLIKYCLNHNLIPKLALVSVNYVWFCNVPNGELDIEGTLRELIYKYE